MYTRFVSAVNDVAQPPGIQTGMNLGHLPQHQQQQPQQQQQQQLQRVFHGTRLHTGIHEEVFCTRTSVMGIQYKDVRIYTVLHISDDLLKNSRF